MSEWMPKARTTSERLGSASRQALTASSRVRCSEGLPVARQRAGGVDSGYSSTSPGAASASGTPGSTDCWAARRRVTAPVRELPR